MLKGKELLDVYGTFTVRQIKDVPESKKVLFGILTVQPKAVITVEIEVNGVIGKGKTIEEAEADVIGVLRAIDHVTAYQDRLDTSGIVPGTIPGTIPGTTPGT